MSPTGSTSPPDRKSTRLNSSHANISYAVFCLKKKSIITYTLPLFFFFNDTATTEIYTLSLHDALPISYGTPYTLDSPMLQAAVAVLGVGHPTGYPTYMMLTHLFTLPPVGDVAYRVNLASRSEEHTSELQSRQYLVCRLLLEKKKYYHIYTTFVFFF